MKKIIALLLAVIMVMGLATVVSAAKADQDASFTKTYKLTNEGTVNPEETFTFKFSNGVATDAATGNSLTDADGDAVAAPDIPDSTVTFAKGDATVAGTEKTVNVALSGIDWPYVGVYTYDVAEVAGNTTGVIYDETGLKLKVTVAYDAGTDTYYTAFVTLNLADVDPEDGITDTKVGGFTNTYEAGQLDVTKIVTGNMGDQDKYFDFTARFSVPADTDQSKISVTITRPDGSSTEINGGILTGGAINFKLKHGETFSFKNLPYGTTYTVTEADYTGEGYDAPVYSAKLPVTIAEVWCQQGATNNVNGTTYTYEDALVVDTANEAVKVVNNKEAEVDTGIAMDSVPFIVMAVVAVLGLAAFTAKKRVQE